MRADIHPKYQTLVATCSCGNVIETRSALGKETICHPFYTGKQKNVDTGGRIDKFKQRFSGMSRSIKR